MKLLFCISCQDVFKLRQEKRTCFCGKSEGQYLDTLNAEMSGDCIPLGMDNNTFIRAINSFARSFESNSSLEEINNIKSFTLPIQSDTLDWYPSQEVEEFLLERAEQLNKKDLEWYRMMEDIVQGNY